MTVNGPDVIEPHFLEQGTREHHPFNVFFRTAREFPHGGHLAQHLLAAFAQMRIHAARQGARQIIGQGADILRNRHVVVVEDDQEIGRQRTGMVERLEGHARGQRAVADDGHGPAFLPALRGRYGHPQGRADRCAGVSDAESVVFAFRAARKWRQTLVLLDGVEPLAAAGQHLVRVGLVPHVPNEPVIGGVKHVMQGNGELHGTQTRGKMTPSGADAVDQELTQLLRQLGQLGDRQMAQIGRRFNGIEQGVACGGGAHLRQFILWRRPSGNGRHPMLQICTTGGPLT